MNLTNVNQSFLIYHHLAFWTAILTKILSKVIFQLVILLITLPPAVSYFESCDLPPLPKGQQHKIISYSLWLPYNY